MSKALREELQKIGRRSAKKALKASTPEQRKAWARDAAIAMHRKKGHKVKADQANNTTDANGAAA